MKVKAAKRRTKKGKVAMNNHSPVAPTREQIEDARARHPDKLLLFRMKDGYESYDDDAATVFDVLSVELHTLDGRFTTFLPVEGLDKQIAKLLQAGHKVAICEQVEDK